MTWFIQQRHETVTIYDSLFPGGGNVRFSGKIAICSVAVSGDRNNVRFDARPACMTFSTDDGTLGIVLSS